MYSYLFYLFHHNYGTTLAESVVEDMEELSHVDTVTFCNLHEMKT